MTVIRKFLHLLFPPKCILCHKLLGKNETDLCHHCRSHTQSVENTKRRLTFVAGWTALWYYKDDVRKSILRYKFYNARHYADPYARLLALKVSESLPDFDVITWVPIGPVRRLKRGYDQGELLAIALSRELGVPYVHSLKKPKDNPAQSGISNEAKRRANVLGAYRIIDYQCIAGKKVLLLDDVVTTGSTVSECARMLLSAGAKEVYCAAIATASHK